MHWPAMQIATDCHAPERSVGPERRNEALWAKSGIVGLKPHRVQPYRTPSVRSAAVTMNSETQRNRPWIDPTRSHNGPPWVSP